MYSVGVDCDESMDAMNSDKHTDTSASHSIQHTCDLRVNLSLKIHTNHFDFHSNIHLKIWMDRCVNGSVVLQKRIQVVISYILEYTVRCICIVYTVYDTMYDGTTYSTSDKAKISWFSTTVWLLYTDSFHFNKKSTLSLYSLHATIFNSLSLSPLRGWVSWRFSHLYLCTI